MHIAITGSLGSGKTTICTYLERRYGFSRYSTGSIQRSLAAERNMTTLEMNAYMGEHSEFDKMIDEAVAQINRERIDENIVFDSRLAWHFAKDSYKVFITVDIDVAAERVFRDDRGATESYTSKEEAKELLVARVEEEQSRYERMYGIDYSDWKNYDLVLDSTHCDAETLGDLIYQLALSSASNSSEHKGTLLISPRRL
ncbi:MAG: cytidylate kinase family protein [Coriobacteriia bacterium]|nr:cytidylate kinase family protein [Coriobacteriia bacterium]